MSGFLYENKTFWNHFRLKKKGCLEGFGLSIRNQERTDDKMEETKTASVSQDLRLNTET